jgi:hypothetical protein
VSSRGKMLALIFERAILKLSQTMIPVDPRYLAPARAELGWLKGPQGSAVRPRGGKASKKGPANAVLQPPTQGRGQWRQGLGLS